MPLARWMAGSDDDRSSIRTAVSGILFVVTLVIMVALVYVELATPIGTDPVFFVPVAFGAAVGLFLSVKRPENRVGLVVSGINAVIAGLGLANVLQQWAPDSGSELAMAAAFLSYDTAFVLFFLLTMVLLPLWFPTGHPPSPRWSVVAWVAVVGSIIPLIGFWLSESVCIPDAGAGCEAFVPNPWGITGWNGNRYELVLLIPMVMAIPAIASSFVRWRSADGVEKQQLKWFVAAAALLVLGFLSSFAIVNLSEPVVVFITPLTLVGVWGSIAIAVTKHRLYDIDRIINLSVVYGLVITVLVAVFVGGAISLPTLLPTSDNSLAIATTTLAVFVLFQPLRKRIQRLVDRRFYRSRYDAEEVAGRVVVQLRDELNPDTVIERWADAVNRTMQPHTIGYWIRSNPGE